MNLKLITYDFDDTLIQTVQYSIPLWQASAAAYGLPERTAEQWLASWGGGPTELVKRVYAECSDAEQFYHFHMERQKALQSFIPAMPGAKETLEKLASKYRQGILSSRGRVLFSMRSKVLPALFDFDFLAEDCEHLKPDPRVFDPVFVWAENVGVHREEIVYVGDSLEDYRAARGAGISFVGVTTGITSKEVFCKDGLEERLILESVAQLPLFLERLKM